jgi:hypothetical protein
MFDNGFDFGVFAGGGAVGLKKADSGTYSRGFR